MVRHIEKDSEVDDRICDILPMNMIMLNSADTVISLFRSMAVTPVHRANELCLKSLPQKPIVDAGGRFAPEICPEGRWSAIKAKLEALMEVSG